LSYNPDTEEALGDDISFEPPESLEGARRRKGKLQDDIESIQFQLSDPNKKEKGERMPSKKYHKWRKYAVKALTAKKRELRFAKRWIRNRQDQLASKKYGVDLEDTEELLVSASNLLQEKIQQRCDFSEEELMLANMIRNRVMGIVDTTNDPEC